MDKKLVLQAKKHDKEAFVKLVENYQVSMYKTAIAILQNDEDAAECHTGNDSYLLGKNRFFAKC